MYTYLVLTHFMTLCGALCRHKATNSVRHTRMQEADRKWVSLQTLDHVWNSLLTDVRKSNCSKNVEKKVKFAKKMFHYFHGWKSDFKATVLCCFLLHLQMTRSEVNKQKQPKIKFYIVYIQLNLIWMWFSFQYKVQILFSSWWSACKHV